MKGQHWNAQAVGSLFQTATRPSLLVPHVRVSGVDAIDFARLRRSGATAVVFDKDNTITAPYALSIHPPFLYAWQQSISVFGRENVVIVSNSAGSNNDMGHKEALRIQEALDVHVLRHTEKKPGGAHELLSHLNNRPPTEVAVIGDRLLTDVVYANKMGALSILTTNIITEKGDNGFAIVLRRFEKRVLLPMLGLFGVKAPRNSVADRYNSGA
ncbi:hypothetical protein HDU81_006788 [Chytriomyces hyalinus]|nr:hypothetical protein HDU81_006788 [Chytriomyces hyalinus]